MEISEKLVNDCLKKDRLAQRELYYILLPYLNSVVKRYLYNDSYREDVLQETFINIFMNIDKFDKSKSQLKTWAVRIAINSCLKNNIKLKRMPTTLFELNHHSKKIDPEVLNKLSNEDLISFLKKMPVKYFEVFNLYVIDDYSHKEIANVLGIDSSLSRKRLSRARDWLSSRSRETKTRKMLIEKLILL